VWIVGCGLRDCVEAVGFFLERLRLACALYWLTSKDQFTGAEYHDNLGANAEKRFHRLGLPDKISDLADRYEFSLVGENMAHILSINQARNCLTHRSGVVAAKDANSEGRLQISWETPELVATRDGREFVLSQGTPVNRGDQIRMRTKQTHRIFNVGETLIFSASEFTELCWTLFRFGVVCIEVLNRYGTARGVRKAEAADTTIPQDHSG